MQACCQQYLAWVRSRSSANTAGAYERDLRAFAQRFIHKQDPSQVSAEDIDLYLDSLQGEMTPASVCRRLSVIRGFYKYLASNGLCGVNPTLSLRSRNANEKKRTLEILDRHQVELLLSQPDPQDPKGRRDKAMLELLYATGMRVSELLDLTVSNVNVKTGLVLCQCGKRSRAIPLYPLAIRYLEEYLSYSRPFLAQKGQETDVLFLNLSGERMTRQGFWKLLKEYAAKAGISVNISPHTLRHSFALHLLENGADAKEVQSIMGNADAATIKGYVKYARSHVNDMDMERLPHAINKKG